MIDSRLTSAATDYMSIPNASSILYDPFKLRPANPSLPYPKDAKEFLERKIKELRELVRGLKSQLVIAENELYEHEKDLNKLVS